MQIVLFQAIQFSINTHFKIFLFQASQFIQIDIIQVIPFRLRTDFIYTQLNVKTVLY